MPNKAARQLKIDTATSAIEGRLPEVGKDKAWKFLVWATELFLESTEVPPSTEDLLTYVTDGKDDLEVDAYYIDEDAQIIYLFQSKFRSVPGNTSKKDIADFCEAPSRLCSPHFLAANTNEKILEFAPTFREKIVDGYELQLVMVTTLNLTPAISEEASQWTQRQMNLSIAGVEVPVTHSLTVCDIDDLLTRYESTSDPAPIVVDLKLQTNQWHMATAGGFRCLVATVAGEQLAQLFQQHRYAMFKYNPRGPLGSVRVNKEVVSTLEDTIEREMFLLLNNGLSGLCESFTPPSEMGGTIHTHVRDFQIVNGCQTTYNIWNHWRRGKSLEGVSVSLKLVEGALHNIGKISRSSNSQSPMKDWDFLFDDEVQVRLQKEFDQMSPSIFYELKRGEQRFMVHDRRPRLRVKDVAQTTYAFFGFPGEAKDRLRDIPQAREKGSPLYRKVFFPNVTAEFLYLPWLIHKRILEKHEAYVEQTGKNGDHREHGRLHILWLIGRSLTGQILGKKEQWAYGGMATTDIREILGNIDAWFDQAHQIAVDTIQYVTDVENGIAKQSNQVLSLRQLFRSSEKYSEFAEAHDSKLLAVGDLPIKV